MITSGGENTYSRKVEFRGALPLSGAGKIMKNVLRDPCWKGAKRAVA